MATITLNDLDTCTNLDDAELGSVAGGISWGLQMQLNQLQANLNANSYIFDPNYIYGVIRSSQQAWRTQYGRQMPYFFPMPQW